MSDFGELAKMGVRWCGKCARMTYWSVRGPMRCVRCVQVRKEKRRAIIIAALLVAVFVWAVAKAARLI